MANFYGNDSNDSSVLGGYVNYYGGNGNDILKGVAGASQLYGGDGNDALAGGLPDLVNVNFTGDGTSSDPYKMDDDGVSGDDDIYGGNGQDALYGMDGNDVLSGGEGDDSGTIASSDGSVFYVGGLFGGDGDDTLYGGGGKDDLYGGMGADEMYGGKDADTFYFSSVEEIGKKKDYIGDFRGKQGDMIDLSMIDAKEKKSGDQKFKYIGDSKFHGKQGELMYKNGKVKGDTDGDGKADFVLLVNTHKMSADDFHL